MNRIDKHNLTPNLGTWLILSLFLLVQVSGVTDALDKTEPTEIPTQLSYQGLLTDSEGNPVPDGDYVIRFRFYDDAMAGTLLWTEYQDVTVADALFNALLGTVTPLYASTFDNCPCWLGVKVGTDSEMQPRQLLASVPFSIGSLSVADGSITTDKLTDGAVTQLKLADNSVSSAKIVDESVGSEEIANGAVTQSEAPYLAGTQWSNRKVIVSTWVGDLDASGLATIDISAYNFTYIDGIVVVNGHDAASPNTQNAMANINWWSANNTSYFEVRFWKNGSVLPNTHVRVNYVIMGEQ